MVDLDSSPTKLIDIVRIGKQLLMTRGSLTTFSIANDVASILRIIPALFMGLYPGLAALNIVGLHSAQSAIFSAIIYNALIIVALIPLALKGLNTEGIRRKLLSRTCLFTGRRNYRPFICIKLIDMMLTVCGLFAQEKRQRKALFCSAKVSRRDDRNEGFQKNFREKRPAVFDNDDFVRSFVHAGHDRDIRTFFKDKANGSIIEVNGVKYGSGLLGQQFTDPEHLWGRIMILDVSTYQDEEGNPLMYAGASNKSPPGRNLKNDRRKSSHDPGGKPGCGYGMPSRWSWLPARQRP